MSSPTREEERQQSAESSSVQDSFSDKFNSSSGPLSLHQMMVARRKSRPRPRNSSFSALRLSSEDSFLRNSGGNDSQSSRDNNAKTSFRRDSAFSSHGGSERSGGSGTSDHGGTFSIESQMNRRRDTKATFSLTTFLNSGPNSNGIDERLCRRRITDGDESNIYTLTTRRYAVGQYVLISNHDLAEEGTAKFLVNRYGFPEGGGASTPEQRRGPYIYLLAKVQSVHFEEDAQYYTVSRCDNEEQQRADVWYMEPITDPIGIEAAKTAARKQFGGDYLHDRGNSDRIILCSIGYATSRCMQKVHRRATMLYRKMKEQASKFLNGRRPYKISFKFSGVNFLVLCSLWYLYIDQFRLAFFPHTADFACAIISCIVWFVLSFELILEVFIRPSEWRALIKSDKAYLPSTCRYLSTFHLIAETIALVLFIPEFYCVFSGEDCGGERNGVSLGEMVIKALFGPDKLDSFYGNAYLCLLRLRIFGLVRHWTKMWLNSTFVLEKNKKSGEWQIKRGKGLLIPQGKHVRPEEKSYAIGESGLHESVTNVGRSGTLKGIQEAHEVRNKHAISDDFHLTNASKIGTALFMTNTRRALIWLFVIGLSPLVEVAFTVYGGADRSLINSVEMLQANNLMINTTTDLSCEFFRQTVVDWMAVVGFIKNRRNDVTLHLLHLIIEPVRCGIANITDAPQTCKKICGDVSTLDCEQDCAGFAQHSDDERMAWYEETFSVRPNEITMVESREPVQWTYSLPNGTVLEADFFVKAQFAESLPVKTTNVKIFALQLGVTIFILLSLSILRFDAGRFVLGPLRRMLKIVAWYAKNPLLPLPKRERNFETVERSMRSSAVSRQSKNAVYYDSDDDETSRQLGNFETDALINTVTKITDLLRRCWGVAGANIISANLARQEGGLASSFNPTVPGEAAYALFAFIGINNFDKHLSTLKGDIMILINDIAAVLHEEVYRWGYEDSGQCNKNLGGAFLMVYKIGAVKEVIGKLEQAEAVIFSRRTTKLRRRSRRITGAKSPGGLSAGGSSALTGAPDRMSHLDSIDLSSLPGMRTFADRALLGLLKTFVGIHRDKTILEWNDDFRLGAGVGAASINLIFGMDAGWAVEGAVGSAYKIDATYLSPHVNMASRMMSATKQYGVYFLLSESVQKLLSENAKTTLRHLDTVTVKGSSVQQKIFTYDAKVRSDFFLYSKTESQADLDSDRYSTSIWYTDQDLCAMRSHVSDEFIATFTRGRDEYLAGNWPEAIELLVKADKLMCQAQLEEGYECSNAESSFRHLNIADESEGGEEESQETLAMGDGPSHNLIEYMKSHGGKAPSNWPGYRALTSK